MRENGTDRDVALSILTALTTMETIVSAINDDLFTAHITTQPSNQTVALNASATFSVVADNVKSYQWQYKNPSTGNWVDTTIITGYNTDTITVTATAVRDGWSFRCQVTGKDGVVVTSDPATLTISQE